jgi:hypothetical protein
MTRKPRVHFREAVYHVICQGAVRSLREVVDSWNEFEQGREILTAVAD